MYPSPPITSAPALSPGDILERNLAALRASSPRACELIRSTPARTDITYTPTDEEVLSATMGTGPSARALGSRRRPLEEAKRLIETVDISEAAAVAILGFGLGYHVKLMAQKMKLTGVVFIFEPDVALLRSILENIDHSAWIRGHNVCLLTDAEDAASISSASRGVEGLLSLGCKFLTHPADRVRLGTAATRFEQRFTEVIKSVRTTVVTTLMQAGVTLSNELMNLDRYATAPGLMDLHGFARSRPAIVVAAGPSLRRNIDVLLKPGVRDRFVIIAVQTVLKQLLAKGIKPHYVTALDYHEISKRFYEGLTPADVEGITLVAEAKANPAITGAFPGLVRFPGDRFIDEFLGPELTREFFSRPQIQELPGGVPAPAEATLMPGATVAHMAYYLARKLGCDPVILMGQDLGFTDGQYYSANAAIHTVWSGELNPFNTLEMMEWQRIARGKYFIDANRTEPNLVKRSDTLGRPIYTDQQMSTYLTQFERDFKADIGRGLTTIDATEGGVSKAFTTPMTLADAIERYKPTSDLRLPIAPPPIDAPKRLKKLRDRARSVRQDVWKVGELSRKTKDSLSEMLKHHADQSRVNRLIGEVQKNGTEVAKLEPAFGLVQHLNQTGTLKRVKEDRRIGLDDSLSPLDRQKRQIERDIMNVGWLADAADQLGSMLDATIKMLDGGPRITTDIEPKQETSAAPRERQRIAALIAVDPTHSGLGTPRDLSQPLSRGLNPLALTLRRLANAKQLDTVILLAENPDQARQLAGEVPGLKYEVIKTDSPTLAARADAIRAARLWAAECWRGGLGTLTIYDEACAAPAMHKAMEEKNLDAAVLIGADWSLVDPAMIDDCVDRFRKQSPGPQAYRVSFVQAPPGLGACLLDRGMLRDMSERAQSAGVFATLGGVLGYVPLAPTSDPIAKPACITTEPTIRDAQFRFIPDSVSRRAAIAHAIDTLGDNFAKAPAKVIVPLLNASRLPTSPREVIMELCTGRRTSGLRHLWLRGQRDSIERPCMTFGLAGRILTELAALRPDAALTLAGAGDPISHPELTRIIRHAKKVGIGAVHVRTDLVCDTTQLDALLESAVDVISIDLMANSAETYRTLMGADFYAQVRSNLEHLLARRASRPNSGGLPTPWVIPRITRCDTVYAELEDFYDHWLLTAGAAVIDPLPHAIPGERIEPLPIPSIAATRLSRGTLTILSDGTVAAHHNDLSGDRPIGDLNKEHLADIWRRLESRTPSQQIEPSPLRSLVHAGASRVAQIDVGL